KLTSISEMQKLHFGSKIICSDGDDGFLMQVIFDLASHRITHIGVKQRRIFGNTVYLPYDTVVSETGTGITILATLAHVAKDRRLNAPVLYRAESVLQREVVEALFGTTPLHIDLKGISARVLDGVLYLDGNISSSLRGDIARDQAIGVSGLLEVKNNLVGDDTL